MNKKFDFDNADDCARLRRLFEILGLTDVDTVGGGCFAYEGTYGTLIAQGNGRNPLTAENGPFSLLLLVNQSDAGLTVQICGDWDWKPLQIFAEGELTLGQIAGGMAAAVEHFTKFRNALWEPMIAKAIEEAKAEEPMTYTVAGWRAPIGSGICEIEIGRLTTDIFQDPDTKRLTWSVRFQEAGIASGHEDPADGEHYSLAMKRAQQAAILAAAEVLSRISEAPVQIVLNGGVGS